MLFSQRKFVEWFLRLSISAGFISAVADRFGLWPKEVSAWGNWNNFLDYTRKLNPLIPESLIPVLGIVATALEIMLGIALLTNFRTVFFAKCSGILLLLFGFSMILSVGIKAPLDYSVFSGAAAAFGLSFIVDLSQQKQRL